MSVGGDEVRVLTGCPTGDTLVVNVTGESMLGDGVVGMVSPP